MPTFGIMDLLEDQGEVGGSRSFRIDLKSGDSVFFTAYNYGELGPLSPDELCSAIFDSIAEHLHLPLMDRKMMKLEIRSKM